MHRVSSAAAAPAPSFAAAYMLFTLNTAFAERSGRGGLWKGEAGPRADPA